MTPKAMTRTLPDGDRCPVCGAHLHRVHRDPVQRFFGLFRQVHRYHCTNPGCDWHGLVGGDPASLPLRPRSRGLLPAVLAGLLVVAVGGAVAHYARLAMRPVATAQPAKGVPQAPFDALLPGVDLDGHAVLDAKWIVPSSPLKLRRDCAWGTPGRDPYRGTVEQALTAAKVPPEVVREVADQVQRGWSRDELLISRDGVRSATSAREFSPLLPAMAFGESVCLNTRVNFPPGHVEKAKLYEARDSRGALYTVMIPEVCGNVTLVGARGYGVPEPSTLWLLLLGGAALTWSRSRTARGGVARR